MEGFKYYFENKNLCTICSASNYRGHRNKASILKLDKNLSNLSIGINLMRSIKGKPLLSPPEYKYFTFN